MNLLKATPEDGGASASPPQEMDDSKNESAVASQPPPSIAPGSVNPSFLSGLDKTITALSGFSILLGLSVIIGWHIHSHSLIQVAPSFVPMQYNTALGFVLCGTGLMLFQIGWGRATVVCGIIAFAIGALTLIQYIFGVNIGIDEMLMSHYVTVATSHPGRMAPNAALSFSLSGVALVLAGLAIPRRSLLMSMLGSLIFALGAVAFYGYLGGLETAYGWGNLTRMAVHTTVGFMALGLCVIRVAWVEGMADEGSSPRWLPVPLVVGTLTALLLMEQAFLTTLHWQAEARIITWLMMASLLGLAVGMAQMYQQKAAQMRETNLRLEDQIAIREQVDAELKKINKEKTAYIHYLTSVNRIYKAFEPAFDLETALPVALNKLLSIFDCDRVWLLYPVDIGAKTYKIPFEQTKPEYPGAFSVNKELPVTKDIIGIFKATLDSTVPLSMNLVEGITDESQLKEFDIKTQLVVPLYPKAGKPWMLGMHQCSRVREWTVEEKELFHAISLVISDKLNNLLLVRNLTESEERHRILFNNASVGIVISGEKGKIVAANETFLKMMGYSRQEVMDTAFDELFALREDGAVIIGQLSRDGEVHDFETIFRRKDGSEFDASLTLTRYDLGGQPVTQTVILDITERKEAEKALIAAKEEAERANKAKTVFLSSISHEIRTPLTSIMGFSRLLEWDAEPPLSDTQKKLLAKVTDSGNQLLDLINNVLDLSKIESGTALLSIADLEMDPLAVTAITAVGPLAEKHGVNLVRKKAAADLRVLADHPHLLQAMINLLSNAIKYNRRGGETTLSYGRLDENTLRISISDTGHGIPKEKIADLFKPFDRLGREGTNIDGTGIGLTIAKRAVELMGGGISVESRVDEGSTFHIDLPLGGKPKQEAEKPVAEKRGRAIKSKDRKGSVLYIEDNRDNVDLMRLFLKNWPNVKMLSSERAEEGIEIARNQKPDLVLMDISLPGMSGMDALKELKRHKETRDIPVWAVSARAMKHEVEVARSAGFDGYITKPFDAERLIETLDDFFTGNPNRP